MCLLWLRNFPVGKKAVDQESFLVVSFDVEGGRELSMGSRVVVFLAMPVKAMLTGRDADWSD